ncbi:HpcH/HpaI aldolase/citrate lyase family protein [Pseudomonas sp. CFBP 13602]|uniref:HpcH/HpaI aldolase/citrate lyase family protein n=1 Tax=Pseudomonas sp. CFBP 13602 TaxID=2774039 RepID=UPI0017834BE9|nr:CoA ester lyase [Pseudomonas sp. CFBP 13602]MBD8828570.1 CoA ester lyase [Pseudomonas sp. CFBP 13602]
MSNASNQACAHDVVRSALFVPGDRPERYSKALASGADRVIIDFEDAVEEGTKAVARQQLGDFLIANPEASVWVRVNSPGHVQHEQDLSFCRAHDGVVAIMLPKAETKAQIEIAAATGKPVVPIIESAVGAANLSDLCSALGLERLCFGAIDMALDLGLKDGSAGALTVLEHLKASIIVQSRVHVLAPALDGVFPAIDDSPGLMHAVETAVQMGFGGVLCIHPKQVMDIHLALAPEVREINWANRVLAAAETQRGAFKLDGQMIDAPVLARARRIFNSVSN